MPASCGNAAAAYPDAGVDGGADAEAPGTDVNPGVAESLFGNETPNGSASFVRRSKSAEP